MSSGNYPVQGAGLGLRRALLGPLRTHDLQEVDFMEVAPENWINVGGRLGRSFREFTGPCSPLPSLPISLNWARLTASRLPPWSVWRRSPATVASFEESDRSEAGVHRCAQPYTWVHSLPLVTTPPFGPSINGWSARASPRRSLWLLRCGSYSRC